MIEIAILEGSGYNIPDNKTIESLLLYQAAMSVGNAPGLNVQIEDVVAGVVVSGARLFRVMGTAIELRQRQGQTNQVVATKRIVHSSPSSARAMITLASSVDRGRQPGL